MLKRTGVFIVGVIIFVIVFFLDSLNLTKGAIFFNIAMTICSFLMCHEFYKAVEQKDVKPIKTIGYLCTLFLLPIGVVETKTLSLICASIIPLIIFICFMVSIFSKLKYNVIDVAITVFGAIYTVLMVAFLSATRIMEHGEFLIFYIICGAWASDTLAYLIGKFFGKHKFSEISPKKSIEGCIAGVFGTVIFYVIYSIVLNNVMGDKMEVYRTLLFNNYPLLILFGIIVSVVSQIGDFAASSIKRYTEIKDFSHLMPGHGGMLDRFDSILFVAPVVYYVFYVLEYIYRLN